jgi:hypothetical protein
LAVAAFDLEQAIASAPIDHPINIDDVLCGFAAAQKRLVSVWREWGDGVTT